MGRGFFAGSQLQQQAPRRALPQCGACKLHRKCRSAKLSVRGDGKLSVLVVGPAPTQDDDAAGMHWADTTRLAKALGKGVDPDRDLWFANALACHPVAKGYQRQPTSAEVGYCRPNITKIIRELRPQVIIPMGASAVNSVLGSVWGEDVGQMERWAGWQIPSQDLNAWVCPTWHPNHLVAKDDQVLERQFDAHITQALACQGVPWPNGAPNWAANVEHVTDPMRAARWLRKCATRQTGAIAWDYETNMLKPDGPDAKIVSCAVAYGHRSPERAIAFPWVGEAVVAMGELLRSPVPKIASNLKFEDRWTRKAFGHRVRAWAWDTMLAAHVADNRPAITSVKFQAFIRHGVPVWNDKIEPFLKSKGDEQVNRILQEIDMDDLLRYNGLDAWLEFMVAADQCNELGVPLPWPLPNKTPKH